MTIFYIAIIYASPLLAQDESETNTLTPQSLVQLHRVSQAKISPDGKKIAYTLSVPRPIYTDDDGPAWTELHLVDMNGMTRPYITDSVNITSLDWTPDGAALSFLAQRDDDEHKALYVIPYGGGEARKALEFDTDIIGYSWFPGGRKVAFTAKPEPDNELNKDKEHGFDAKVFEEDFQNTGIWIAAIDFDKPGPDRDEANQPQQLTLAGSASTIRVCPDGKRLAVALAPTPFVDDSYMKRKIHIVDIASGKSLAQIGTDGKIGAVHWSPDGSKLALVAGVDRHDPREGRLMLADADHPTPVNLVPDYPGHIWSFAWQNDDTLMFLGQQGVWTSLEKVNADGSDRKVIIEPGSHTLSGLTLSGDGQTAAFTGDSPAHPAEVYTMKHGDAGPRRLTVSNPSLEDIQLARQEVITFKARDGLELEGILIHPLDEKPDQRYPLIMMVHGGPESHHRNGWLTTYSLPGQVAAARGFASFYTNYRGSTGRGVPFSKLSQADPAGKEFDDLVDAVNHLVQIGLVDKDKVGITGGSYGGYASAWAATALTEHFAASVMFVGISDHFLAFSLSDIPEEHVLVHILKYPWEDMDFVRRRSPITYFEKSRTPLLILHGDSDTRVHPAHSLGLYRMLKTYGKSPVRLVLYPGEGHGNRRTGSRLDVCLRLMRWMNHYLKGPADDPPPWQLDLAPFRPQKPEKTEDRE